MGRELAKWKTETFMSESMIAKNDSIYRNPLEKTGAANARPGSEMLSTWQWDLTADKLRLTRREKEVCKELFEGNTRNEIADHLGIKPRTVRHYMEHIHQKLAVTNRVGVVLRIIQIRDMIDNDRPEPPPQTMSNFARPTG